MNCIYLHGFSPTCLTANKRWEEQRRGRHQKWPNQTKFSLGKPWNFLFEGKSFFRKPPLSSKSRASTADKTGFSQHLLAFATFSLLTLYSNTYAILVLSSPQGHSQATHLGNPLHFLFRPLLPFKSTTTIQQELSPVVNTHISVLTTNKAAMRLKFIETLS